MVDECQKRKVIKLAKWKDLEEEDVEEEKEK